MKIASRSGVVEKVLREGAVHKGTGRDVSGRLNVRFPHSSDGTFRDDAKGDLLALKRENVRFLG